MTSKYIVAFSALLALAAGQGFLDSPLCDSWTPLGNNFQPEDTLGRDLSCTPSADGKSIELRVEVTDSERQIIHLMGGIVFPDGKGVPGGRWEPLPDNYRTVTCSSDESPRVVKVDDAKEQTAVLTYIFEEDSEVTAEEVSCRFFLAESETTYWEDQTVAASGEQATIDTAPGETPAETTTGTLPQETGAPQGTTPQETALPEETGSGTDEIDPFVQETSTDETFEQTTDELDEFNESVDSNPVVPPEVDTAPTFPETTEGVTSTAAPVQSAFPVVPEETSGDGEPTDVAPDSGFIGETSPVDVTPDTGFGDFNETEAEPGSGEEFQNEPGTEVIDPNLVEQAKPIRVGEVKSAYYCEESGNTYVLAPSSDCRMFYQGIIKEGSDEMSPLGTFSCGPGSRFHTGICTCVMYESVNCPDADPSFVPPSNPIAPGKEKDASNNVVNGEGSGEVPSDVQITSTVTSTPVVETTAEF